MSTHTHANNIASSYDRYLTQRGYIVRKHCLAEKQIAQLRKDLCVEPYNPVKVALLKKMRSRGIEPTDDMDDSFKIYQENTSKFYLPRYYAEAKFGAPEHDSLKECGQPFEAPLIFHGALRQPQIDVADKTVAHLDSKGAGILQLRCGFGKTIIALYLAARLGMRTIVLVHKEFLMNQWKERIAEFLPAASVGTLQAKVVDVEGRDIVIGMLQSIAVKKYEPGLLGGFGLAIYDECHHLGACVFSKALGLTRTRYMLGLSATPDRKDRLRKVFDWQLGEVICKVEAKVTQRVEVRTVSFEDPDVVQANGQIIIKMQGGATRYKEGVPAFRHKLLEHLVTSAHRRAELLGIITGYASDPRRRILVLSERRNHLLDIGSALEKVGGISYGFYWGGVKQSELEDAATKQVVLGTYHMASEGMDVPVLNTVVLASPKSDIQQSVGRILRRTDHPVTPTVVDFVDAHIPCFARVKRARDAFYASSGFVKEGEAGPPAETPVCGMNEDTPKVGYGFR